MQREIDEVRKQQQQQQYFIDGPGRMTSALQLLPPPSSSSSSLSAVPNVSYSNLTINPKIEQEEEEEHQDYAIRQTASELYSSDPDFANSFVTPMANTIVASDNEASNGFVRDGRKLPYVFEANDSGTRKRSSKILPVCGVCGKRFVCVTTMKRHLVTHTGEKPFACKICGKQYTQKGNLRVHERTHRNDRPFECNICYQKFYRKEPMQKHQWRQHGVVHFKSRPNLPNPPSTSSIPADIPVDINVPQQPSVLSEGVRYNSIVDQIKKQSFETFGESSRDLNGPSPPPPSQPKTSYASFELITRETAKSETTAGSAAMMAAAALNMTTSSNKLLNSSKLDNEDRNLSNFLHTFLKNLLKANLSIALHSHMCLPMIFQFVHQMLIFWIL